MTQTQKALQDVYASKSICFGCGPANAQGLKIKTIAVSETETTCEWKAQKEHEAFPGMLSGGIIGTLLDCHSNWTAAWHLMKKSAQLEPPCTVTADYHVKLLRPTPSAETVYLTAKVISSTDDRAEIEATLTAGGKLTATCRGLFVSVKPGHPAYNRWGA